MKSTFKNILVPLVIVAVAAVQVFGVDLNHGIFPSPIHQYHPQDSTEIDVDTSLFQNSPFLTDSLSTSADSVAIKDTFIDVDYYYRKVRPILYDTIVTKRDSILSFIDTLLSQRDSVLAIGDSLSRRDSIIAWIDTVISHRDSILVLRDTLIQRHLTGYDTIVPPEELRETFPLKYKYYVAIKDSTARFEIRDSLLAVGDTTEWEVLQDLYLTDSLEVAEAAFQAWYWGLTKKERKKYDFQQSFPARLAAVNAKMAHQDSVKARRDSIIQVTPRILDTYALPDSLHYKRIIKWTHDPRFNDLHVQKFDTSYNYHFNDLPIYKGDEVNAVNLGVAGSASMSYDYFHRPERNDAFFYTAALPYTYTIESLPFYNTKTYQNELAYWGTLLGKSAKEESNIHIFSSQNITPALNITFEYNRYGSYGMLQNENTDNRTFVFSTNYVGKRYLMHAAYIYNRVKRTENGGMIDNFWIRDTTVESKEIDVYLNSASSRIKQNTVFLDQSYRIPFNFIKEIGSGKRKAAKAEAAYRDSIYATGDSLAIVQYLNELAQQEFEREEAEAQERAMNGGMELPPAQDDNVTTAFIGHSSEYSVFTRNYEDVISLTSAADTMARRHLYNNNFYINPTTSTDSMRVMRLENRVYLRLQPWKADGIVSKLDVGVGDRLLNYYNYTPYNFITKKNNTQLNSVYLYAGVKGQYKKFFKWDASGDYTFAGYELNDFSIKANAELNLYPFRRARNSPLTIAAHFSTSLLEPDYYQQELYTNHYKWSNDFGKMSTTKFEGSVSIPRWKLSARASYALLDNNLYYDADGIVQQNGSAMSVLSFLLKKDFAVSFLHFDHSALIQYSSNDEVMPLPLAALHFRYYIQLDVKKNVMQMQIGGDARWTSKWYMPGYNPALGVFYNQRDEQYGEVSPYIDVFVNIQWKRACIFLKATNIGKGWPSETPDYFSAHHYINPETVFKMGIFWPFYVQPAPNVGAAARAAKSGGRPQQ